VALQLGGTAIFTEPFYEIPQEPVLNTSLGLSAHPKDLTRALVQKTGQQLKRFGIPEGATVLFVKDTITTGKSTIEMVNAVNPDICASFGKLTILPYVLCLINRSGKEFVEWDTHPARLKIISLADVNARIWDTTLAAEVDLFDDEQRASFGFNCGMRGLKAVDPKENWDKLVGTDK